ncbi:MAG: DMT family transporter [Rhodothermus sp.]|nr:DMT family transporter [Rhodothermus sp.]
MANRHIPFRVYPILALGLLSFSVSPILVRWAGEEASGLAIATWRTWLAVAMLAPFALPKLRGHRLFGQKAGLTILAGIFLGMHFVVWILSLYYTSVASASVLVCMSPVFLAALGFWVLGERLAFPVVASIGLAVIGAALIGWGDHTELETGTQSLLGNALALAGALLISLYLLIGRVVRQQASWLTYVFPLYLAAAVTALIPTLLMNVPLWGYSPRFYLLCGLMALGPQILGHGSFNYSVKYIPAAWLGLLSLLEPVGASLLAYLMFAEIPPGLSVVGMLLVLGAIAFAVQYEQRTARRRLTSSTA